MSGEEAIAITPTDCCMKTYLLAVTQTGQAERHVSDRKISSRTVVVCHRRVADRLGVPHDQTINILIYRVGQLQHTSLGSRMAAAGSVVIPTLRANV